LSTTSQPIEGGKPAVINCTGRRKEAVARVFLRPGSGKFTVNGREIKDYFHNIAWLNAAVEPLKLRTPRIRLMLLPPRMVVGPADKPARCAWDFRALFQSLMLIYA